MTEATKVPKLKRNARTTETRQETVRRKAWAPPSRLDAPEPPPGYKHRWIRVESGGADDRVNVAAKLREGYELVRADEYPDFDSGVQDDGKHAGVISVGGLLLARIPEETADERREYYSSRTHDQIRAADNDLMKTNVNSSMKINAPERQSKVSLGGPRSGSE